MGIYLKLNATRLITVNKTGKIETQSYSIDVISFKSEECIRIIESADPYKEYCDLYRSIYSELTESVYVWDVEHTSETEKRKMNAFINEDKPEDIAYFESMADGRIRCLDRDIKEALDKGYELEWSINY